MGQLIKFSADFGVFKLFGLNEDEAGRTLFVAATKDYYYILATMPLFLSLLV